MMGVTNLDENRLSPVWLEPFAPMFSTFAGLHQPFQYARKLETM
jgi:hypothetical protein